MINVFFTKNKIIGTPILKLAIVKRFKKLSKNPSKKLVNKFVKKFDKKFHHKISSKIFVKNRQKDSLALGVYLSAKIQQCIFVCQYAVFL